jgi:hypothetical protein
VRAQLRRAGLHREALEAEPKVFGRYESDATSLAGTAPPCATRTFSEAPRDPSELVDATWGLSDIQAPPMVEIF